MTKLIKVDKNDRVLGLVDKKKAHQGKGILHRAFSILIVNDKKEILLQKRSRYKKLWPGYWTNTCCSHPVSEVNLEKFAEKRLKEEMGFSCQLKPLFKFQYQASYKDIGSENELVTVLLGKYRGEKIKSDSREVADFKWMGLRDLIKEVEIKSEEFTPWFKKIIRLQGYPPKAKAFRQAGKIIRD